MINDSYLEAFQRNPIPFCPKSVATLRMKVEAKHAVPEEVARQRQQKLKEYLNLRLPAYGIDLHHFPFKMKKWREIMIGKHYGAPTHLLDFTRNPMAAIYFAALHDRDFDGKLWAVSIKKRDGDYNEVIHNDPKYNIGAYDLLSDEGKGVTPYELTNPFFVVPPQFDGRIRAQDSVFCCFPTKCTSADCKSPECKSPECNKKMLTTPLNKQLNGNNEHEPNFIQGWLIPSDLKQDLLHELNRIGVNGASLFPDLPGFGEFVNWKLSTIK